MAKSILWFKEVGKEDIALVGGKGANLGEMVKAGFPVPPGFIVTAAAYRNFLRENALEEKIAQLLHQIDYNKQESLEKISRTIEKLIKQGNLSEEFVGEVFTAYAKLGNRFSQALVAVRSSATAEDLPSASFAGQQETYLNTKGEANVLLRIKDCWASLFSPRVLFYRHQQKLDQAKVAIAVPIQKMIESVASGVMFSLDPVNNDKQKIIVEAIYGLGELIVQGEVTPDHYEIDKKTLTITEKKIATQQKMMVKKGTDNVIVPVPRKDQQKQKISDKHIVALAELSKKLEHHYYFPQDVEWAIDNQQIYLVQTRPITTVKTVAEKEAESTKAFHAKVPPFLTGDPASPGIASGQVRILRSAKEIGFLKQGEVLVAAQTNPDFVPAMKKAVAIVTDKGGRTSHAAIVAREIGIPAIVGSEKATTMLKTGDMVTVNGITGEVFKGGFLGMHTSAQSAAPAVHTATKVYVNLAEPELAGPIAQRHVDGVGLLRAEFMIADIGTHPKEMLRQGKEKEYVAHLAEGIALFAKSFSPRPVVYRASDFKTNEYRSLKGGAAYEPIEPNPMLGYRGVFRYIHDPEVFALELEAIKQVRNKMGLKNVWLMLPFVRTVAELKEVKQLIASNGLYRSASFKLWMMVEVPSNVILLDKFIEQGIDGVSIGSNDLTMLLLGTDRDNTEVAHEFNEQDDSVVWALEHVVKTAQKYGITSSLCGQAASTYPELIRHLVRWGITSVSVSPDAIEQTRELIVQFERELVTQ